MTTSRVYQTATLLSDGRVLIAGGSAGDDGIAYGGDRPLATAEIYNPATGKFSRTGSMSQTRESGAAVRLADGRVLVAGGDSATADIYDPKTGKFTRHGALPDKFAPYKNAILLPGGKVVMFSVDVNGPAVMTFDPASSQFTDTPLGLAPEVAASNDNEGPETATLLKDGRVLLSESGYLQTYDPATGVATDAGTLTIPEGKPDDLGDPTATLLLDGRVLFAGGYDKSSGSSTPINLAFLYYPDTGPADEVDQMVTAGYGQSATLLPDGSVLFAGGSKDILGGEEGIKSAELYK